MLGSSGTWSGLSCARALRESGYLCFVLACEEAALKVRVELVDVYQQFRIQWPGDTNNRRVTGSRMNDLLKEELAWHPPCTVGGLQCDTSHKT